MIELRVLGALDLHGPDGEEILPVLSQPKRAVLFSYLAISHRRAFHTRDKLVGLFWPKFHQDRARAALRQSLHFLRQHLGEGVILRRGAEEVGLDRERVWCDVITFEGALEREEVEEALELYKGHLLEGVFISDCPDLDKWLEEERERLREMAAGAAWTLAHRHLRAGRLMDAERTGQRALGFVGTDESVVQEFIVSLALAGDRAAAVRFYEKFAEGLRKDLDLGPSAQSRKLAEEIRASEGPAVPARLSLSYLTLLTAKNLDLRHSHEAAAPAKDAITVPWHGRPRVSWSFAAVLVTLAAIALWALAQPEPRGAARSYADWPTSTGLGEFAISPDGSRILNSRITGMELWAREGPKPESLPGSRRSYDPTFSPDGRFIAYGQEREVRIAPVSGGGAFTTVVPRSEISEDREITAVDIPVHPAWGEDGNIYFARDSIIYLVPAEGGIPRPFTIAEDELHLFPHALPEGRGLVLSVRMGTALPTQGNWIAAVGPEGGKPRRLFQGFSPRYAASGHLVYVTADGELMAVRFDPGKLEVKGPPMTMIEGLGVRGDGWGQFALSSEGTLLFVTGDPLIRERELVWRGAQGYERADPSAWRASFHSPKLSPDHTQVALTRHEGEHQEIWVKPIGGPGRQVTFHQGINDLPTWTPDGQYLTFISDLAGQRDVWRVRADGMERQELVLDQERGITEAVWSPDGRWLIYATDPSEEGAGDILAVPADPSYSIPPNVEPVPLAVTPFTEEVPSVSPDGRWLAYLSNESGFREIWVVPFPHPGEERWRLNTGSVNHLVWSHRGTEILFTVGNSPVLLRTVEVETTPTFSSTSPKELFTALSGRFDVGADDESFLGTRAVSNGSAARLVIWENFFEELERMAGG